MALPSFVQPDVETWLQKFRFRVPIRVRFAETDMLGHVNNVSYFLYFEQGRLDYLAHLGVTEELFALEKGKMAVAANLECHYLRQVFYGQPLQLYVRVARIGNSSFNLEYALCLETNGELVAAGRGAMVYVDRHTGKSEPLPESVRETFRAFEKMDG
ncbi:thioesterase family protein [Bacillaceae bacterium]